MIKKLLFICTLGLLTFTISPQIQAQTTTGTTYETAIGLGLDFGDYDTGVGIDLKHFFTARAAGEFDLLFYDDTVGLGAFYEYHWPINNVNSLLWYLGVGPQFYFEEHDTDFGARVMIGLDYKIPDVPLDFSLDWRPLFEFTDGGNFAGGLFQLNIRFVF